MPKKVVNFRKENPILQPPPRHVIENCFKSEKIHLICLCNWKWKAPLIKNKETYKYNEREFKFTGNQQGNSPPIS